MPEPRGAGYRIVRLSLPVSTLRELEAIAEEDGEEVHSVIYRAIGNFIHNRTLD